WSGPLLDPHKDDSELSDPCALDNGSHLSAGGPLGAATIGAGRDRITGDESGAGHHEADAADADGGGLAEDLGLVLHHPDRVSSGRGDQAGLVLTGHLHEVVLLAAVRV